MPETVKIEKLVHGGQGLGVLDDGRKVFVWGVLPGELISVRLTRKKKDYAEGICEEIIQPAPERIKPKEQNYLSTSPWQIMDFITENYWKKAITLELFQQAGMLLPDFEVTHDETIYGYRNKMEYSFWGDSDGLHLALYNRGSHQKQIVQGSALSMPALDKTAQLVLEELNNSDVRAGDLKTLIVRCSQNGRTMVSLFVKKTDLPRLELPTGVQGLRVYFSNPKSPASVPTNLLYELGEPYLTDRLLDKHFVYDSDSFFQVNVPVFELALKRMKELFISQDLVDMYAGVGAIGISLAKKTVNLIELDSATAKMAQLNAKNSKLKASVIQTSSEQALEYIVAVRPVIFDPPRAGLHAKIINRLLEALPPQIIYLSCNPATQARDLAQLGNAYKLSHFEVFNFFPRTPHIESLAILQSSK